MDNINKKIDEVKFYSEDLKADVILVADVKRILTEEQIKVRDRVMAKKAELDALRDLFLTKNYRKMDAN